jgi:hypothetical protein
MSPFGFSPPIFSLDAGFQSCTQASIRYNTKMIHPNCFLPRFWLVLVGYIDVQSMHTRLHARDFGLAARLKFQIARFRS